MIYIIKHKKYENPIPQNYKELYVGDLFNENEDNINYLNPYINEATAIYDIWKNYKDKIVGLCHYRRFFENNNSYLKFEDTKYILRDYDIIITSEVKFNKGIYEQLRSEIENPDILDKYYNILCNKEPNLKKWFNYKSFNPKEMFVCKKEILDKYCEWLFPMIIPITEQFIKEDVEKVVNKRMIGHLVERLFAYWIWKNNLKTFVMNIKEV